jgi:hypothetical protein
VVHNGTQHSDVIILRAIIKRMVLKHDSIQVAKTNRTSLNLESQIPGESVVVVVTVGSGRFFDYFFVFVVVGDGDSRKFFGVGGSGIDYIFVFVVGGVVVGGSGKFFVVVGGGIDFEKGVVHNLLPLFSTTRPRVVLENSGVFNIKLFTLFLVQFDGQCDSRSKHSK